MKEERAVEFIKGVWEGLEELHVHMWRRMLSSREAIDYPPRRLFLERHCTDISIMARTLASVLRMRFEVPESYFQYFRGKCVDPIENPKLNALDVIVDENVRVYKMLEEIVDAAELGKYTEEKDKYRLLVSDLRELRRRLDDLTCLKLEEKK